MKMPAFLNLQVINKPHTPGAYVLNKSFPKQQNTSGTGPAAGLDPLVPAAESSLVRNMRILHTDIKTTKIEN